MIFLEETDAQNIEQQKTYWLHTLSGDMPVLQFPTDCKRPTSPSFAQEAVAFHFDQSLTEAIQTFIGSQHVSLPAFLLAVYQTLLARYAAQDDIVVGMPVSDQAIAQNHVNLLVIRNLPTADKPFSVFLGEVATKLAEAIHNRTYPFAQLVADLGVQTESNRHSLFDVMIAFSEPAQAEALFGKQLEKVDIALVFSLGETIHGEVRFATSLFARSTIERFIRHFEQAVRDLLANPDRALADVEILTETEKHQLLVEFNDHTTNFPKEQTLYQLFEEQVEQNPNQVAMHFEGTDMTYGELNACANQFARYLIAKGVKRADVVGLMVERSLEMQVAIFGILKAGATYLPIDPEFPLERTLYMLEDSQAVLLVTQATLLDSVPFNGPVVTITDAEIGQQEVSNLGEMSTSADVCYMIYTSGTTGKPKGILTTHYNIARVVKETNYVFPTPSDVFLQLSNYAFDGCTYDTYGALLNGAKLIIVNKDTVFDIPKLAHVFREKGITSCFCTVALFNTLVELDVDCLQHVRTVLVGGERLSIHHMRKAVEHIGPGKLLNGYGPTETTVFACYFPIHEVSETATSVPIGRPIANTDVYVLDTQNRIQPIGVPGELCIAGDGVALGYLNRPELNAEKFVPHPFKPGKTMYRSGDLVRWLPDGNIEYLDRIDTQVKIRGFRIELGEIEATLNAHVAIKEAVVVAREDEPGQRYLAAYLVTEREHDLSVSELKAHLSKELPPYMIPTHFVVLECLPLTTNGKVDRRALPKPDRTTLSTDGKYVAPRTAAEGKLVEMWQELLGLERIGIKDDFFSLGGHSLKAAILGFRLQKEYHVQVAPRDVFHYDTIEALAAYIEEAKQAGFTAIEPVEVRDYYPVSSVQKRLFILNQMGDAAFSYNIPWVTVIGGELDRARIEAVFEQLIARHESLRTSFAWVDGEPVQRIHTSVDFKLGYQAASEQELPAIIEAFIEPFDLGQAPLLRAALVELGEQKHALMVDMHHIITDGVSMEVFFDDMSQLYRGLELSALRIQYKDFSAWQNDFLQSEALPAQEAYWLTALAGDLPVLQLPTDFPRPAQQSFEGKTLHFSLGQELTGDLRQLAQQTGTTLYMVLLAAYQVLLSKYSGQEDIIVGTPLTGRSHADVQEIMGMFVNTIAMRNAPVAEKVFTNFLAEVKENALSAYEHPDYPLEMLIEKFAIERDPSRNPLFDTLFTLQNTGNMELALDGLSTRPYPTTYTAAQFDLTLVAMEQGDELDFTLEYATTLFRTETMERMSGHFAQIVRQIVANPNVKLSEIALPTEDEKAVLLTSFNDTQVEYPTDKLFHGLFEEQVEKTPDQVAIAFEQETLTYRELNERANKFAQGLRHKGVQPDTVVGMMTERSLDMVVGIMAILKAGAAYAPIDPAYPEERIAFMLEDSGASYLLTHRGLEAKVAFDGRVITLDDEAHNQGDGANLAHVNEPHHLAYVIYTSGTTGKPKGVMIEHRTITNTLLWGRDEYKFDQTDAVLNLFSFSFDAFVTTCFTPLISGATVVLADAEKAKDPIAVKQYLTTANITHFSTVPSMYMAVLACLATGEAKQLKSVTLGGEKTTLNLIEKSKQKNPHTQLINEYGPTENSVVTTLMRDLQADRPITIGRPIANTHVFILDRHHQLVPIGIPGELCVSGRGLSRGYLHRPDLTAETFIENPFLRGERMYKTGDLVRWTAEGTIDYMGRMDDQVKVRGFRIELGEIETVLLQHEQIAEVVVMAREDAYNQPYLCAYVVASEQLLVSALTTYLADLLPPYMVPSAFVQLVSMPLTPNGKIDRKALPKPNGSMATGVEYVAPRNQTEEQLVAIWQELLGVERIGVRDNFFRIGGHSLKATLLVSKLYKQRGVEVSLRDVFQSPTIEQLATIIEGTATSLYTAIEPVEKREYYPVSSAQKRMLILHQMKEAQSTYNMPNIIAVAGDLDVARLEAAGKQLIARHESLRTSFDWVDGEPVQRVHVDVPFAIERLQATAAFVRPFDLSEAPLFRVAIVNVAEQKHVLMFDMHHIISDGVSMNLLLEELSAFYQGEGVELPTLRVQYKDYAAWQETWFASEAMQQQEAYWLEEMSGDLPVLQLPTDFPRPSVQSFDGDVVRFALDVETTQAVRNLLTETETTMFMVLLAAYHVLLATYSGQDDIMVGTPIAGRSHEDVQNIVGMFVNTLVMRGRLQEEETFATFLAATKDNVLSALENQDYPFEELVEKLDIQRDMSRHPLFDVMFVMQNTGDMQLTIDGLHTEAYPYEYHVAKFDLTLGAFVQDETIAFMLDYSTKLFNRNTVERFVGHYVQIVKAIATNPSIRLSKIDMLTDAERDQLLVAYNQRETAFPKDKTLSQLFEEQAALYPEQAALVFGEETWSYGKLNERANQIARVLREKGVQRGGIVGLMAERSFELIAGIVGILKAGAAYVPIDPELPADRVQFMLEDSQAVVLLTQADLVGTVEYTGPIVTLDSKEMDDQETSNVARLHTASDICYVIYTSGTTGKPKGTLTMNTNVSRIVKDTTYFQVTAADKILQTANYAFDGSVFDFFCGLLNGATLVLISKDTLLDVAKLSQIIKSEQITCFFATTALLNTLVDVDVDCLKGPRKILFGGERCSVRHIQKAIKHIGPNKLLHLYGPSETGVYATYYHVNEVSEQATNVPIGQTMDNTELYVVDAHNRLVPIGVPGELCVGGASLSLGYLNRPALTAEKFVPHPFKSGEKMYRTGDLVKWLPDGNLEYLERIDQQVKIRGFRIELGEIEAKLNEHTSVQEAVVIAREDEPGQRYLAAYVVPEQGAEAITFSELKNHLSQALPYYMIPAHFVMLERLPLTTNGKVDKRVLPKPDGNVVTGSEYVAPRNEMEAQLVAIWQELLGVERIGVRDEFFDLGGHSLKATVLVSKLHKHCNVQVSLRDVFHYTTIEALASLLDTQSEVVATATDASYMAIEPAPERDLYMVSSAQKRLLILDHLRGSGTSYNIPMTMLVEGALDVARLQAVGKQLTERHESLRTSFEWMDGEPYQRISPTVNFSLSYNEASEEEAKVMAQAFVQPFDLTQAPLFRMGLVKVGEDRHVLMMDTHHIISDGVSMNIFLEEMSKLYVGKDAEADVPSLRIHYKDYAEWQVALFESDVMQEQATYWVNALAGDIPVLSLPTDFPRPSMQSFDGDMVTFTLEPELTTALRQLNAKNSATMYMTLLAAYQVLLAKYSGNEDIVVGTPVAGRSHADLQNIIGMFVNTLAMRGLPTASKSFGQFLAEGKENALNAFECQDYPFEELVEKLNLQRDVSRNPLFDTMFALQNTGSMELTIDGLQIAPFHSAYNVSKFDLTVEVTEREEEMSVTINYCTKLFRKETIERMAGHLTQVIREIVSNPNVTIGEINILTPEEKAQIVYEFNDTEAPYSREKLMHQLFEEQVERTPDHVAVLFQDQQLTYRQLNERANQLAHLLQAQGVKTGEYVAIMMDRSLEMIVGILGILKAGGAYVPLEPTLPKVRVEHIMGSLAINYFTTQSAQAEMVKEVVQATGLEHVICLETCEDTSVFGGNHVWTHADIDVQSTEATESGLTSDDIAYVIFTSGSTGVPKGVVVRHQPVINLIEWVNQTFHVGPSDRVLFITSLSFDLSVYDTFGILAAGGSIRIVPSDDIRDPERLLSMIANEPITFWDSAPAALQQLVAFMPMYKEQLAQSKLRLAFNSGDWIPLRLPDTMKEYFPGLQFISLGGATEATIWSNFFPIDELQPHWVSIPYGKPIQNARYYILNAQFQPCPIGVAGELYIGGEALAAGYTDPQSTAERFLPDPFLDNPEARMYRTGDMARWMPEGLMEFLGRVDYQVKIRGYRIELGEIQAVMNKHEQIKEAFVIDRTDSSGQKYLCAYFVSDEEWSTADLREFIAQELPSYMVPSYFIQLEAMPVTANGKLDRKALPEPDASSTISANEYLPPRNEIEEKLAAVWQDVLGIERIGIKDNFFELGGDSIKAIQISARLHKYQLKVELRDLLQHSEMGELSKYVKVMSKTVDQGIVEGDVALTPIQHWFFEKQLTDMHHFNQSIMLHSKRGLDGEAVRAVFDRMTEHHDALRMIYTVSESSVTQTNRGGDGERFSLEVIDMTAETSVEAAIVQEANRIQASINLAHGPLMKLALFQTSVGDHLLIAIHHLVIDGISWRILLEDLATGYNQAIANQPIVLPEKTVSYKEWATQLEPYATSKQLLKEIGYWQKLEQTPVAPIPTDKQASEDLVKQSATLSIALNEQETEHLLKDAHRTYQTEINDLLLTALGITVNEWTNQTNVLIQLEGHGREEIIDNLDISRTIGWFTSAYPVVLDMKKASDLSYQIKFTKETLRQIPNKGVGYGILRYLTPAEQKADLTFHLRPEICFNYLGQFDQDGTDELFGTSSMASGQMFSDNSQRLYTLDISGIITGGKLNVHFQYNQEQYNQTTVQQLADRYKAHLQAIINHCIGKEERELTPTDLGHSELSLEDLQFITQSLGNKLKF